MIKVSELLRFGKLRLKDGDFESYSLEAELLLAKLIAQSKREILLSLLDDMVAEQIVDDYTRLLERRLKVEPISHLLGKKDFWDYEFKVSSEVLTPRADTESIIEQVIKTFPDQEKALAILDLGTGSGCIAITLAKLYKNAKVVAGDISESALKLAKENATLNQVDDRIDFIISDWFLNILEQKFDIIVCNPPYISLDEMTILATEVQGFEPHIALTDFADGLSNYRKIALEAKKYLKPDGKGFFEVGLGQSQHVSKIFSDMGYKVINIAKDLAEIDRCIVIARG